jgi:hypothetical protein
LLQTIQRLVQEADKGWVSRVLKTSRLRAVYSLSENPVKEGVLDVELVNGPLTRQCKGQHRAHRGRFDNRAERLIKVDARTLSEATDDLAGVISCHLYEACA